MYTTPLAHLVIRTGRPLSAIVEAAACTAPGVDDARIVEVDDLGNEEWRPELIDRGAWAEKIKVSREHADLIRGWMERAA